MSKLWGSRFKSATSQVADKFTFSIAYDQRLAKYDVLGSMAHAKMLGKCRIISSKDSSAIVNGLQKILKQIESGSWKFDPKEEDIHSNIQTVLKKMIGAPADRLHTARSRNDQVVCDVKLYCKENIYNLILGVSALQRSILKLAKANNDVIVPAYTHLQAAQVVLFAHHMLAYVEMLERDKTRLSDCFMRLNFLPLGSCALSGSSLPTDRNYVAKELGFTQASANSMDSVSDRDFIVEIIADLSILAMHLSRMSEDLMLWATKEFDFIDIDWSFCTGSSIMPHKKNPDVVELMRGASAQFPGALIEILTLLKALPLTYNRDMQLDKPVLFRSVEAAIDMLNVFSELFANIAIKKENILKRLEADESFFSVDIMEYLIGKGVSYREAHDIVGEMVKECLDGGILLSSLSENQLKKFSKHLNVDVKKLLNPKMSVRIKKSFGSTNPEMVDAQLARWHKILK
ncbi:MAG: argininosuccinate lyase [Candidatus Omnitrophica bacterium]|nr:argininosuccinate lyase [Candidatus Omnitrophota bacterium]